MNKGIRAAEVRVVGSDGEQIGVLPIAEALKLSNVTTLTFYSKSFI